MYPIYIWHFVAFVQCISSLRKHFPTKEQSLYTIFHSFSADVCNNTDLPELEIISLLEEQLPVYKLRADTIFGYEQDDWLHTPLVDPDSALDLTTEQIEETLKYFCKYYSCYQQLLTNMLILDIWVIEVSFRLVFILRL